jgi:hypothetical protein
MPRGDKPVQPGPSINASKLPSSARTDQDVAPSFGPAASSKARSVSVAPAAESEVVAMLAEAIQLLGAGYTVRDVSRRLAVRAHTVWGWAEEPAVKTAIEKGRMLRKQSLGQELEDAAEAALGTLIDLMQDEGTTPKDRLKAAEIILDRCGLVELPTKQVAQVETAVRVDVDFDERLARIVAASRPA